METIITEHSANPLLKDINERSALHYAAYYGKKSCIGLLLDNGNDCQDQDMLGQTPLFAACYSNRAGCADVLVSRGSDVSHKDKKGRRPLHIAALYGSDEVCEVLLEMGAAVEEKDNEGRTPLHLAVEAGMWIDDLVTTILITFNRPWQYMLYFDGQKC